MCYIFTIKYIMNREEWFERIMSRSKYNNHWCIIWQWAKNNSWYWVQKIDWAFWYVHRFVYDYIIWIDKWMTVDHICKTPLCCNIDHLRLLTHYDNCIEWVISSAMKSTKHACEVHNIKRTVGKDGKRRCKICEYERSVKYRTWVRPDLTEGEYNKIKLASN